ncbi:MAG: hypothetical protein LBM98_00260 [Oscillospiraceae bacterium]|nr:hypothetical protein [Oscillospiraceae bacterium]
MRCYYCGSVGARLASPGLGDLRVAGYWVRGRAACEPQGLDGGTGLLRPAGRAMSIRTGVTESSARCDERLKGRRPFRIPATFEKVDET